MLSQPRPGATSERAAPKPTPTAERYSVVRVREQHEQSECLLGIALIMRARMRSIKGGDALRVGKLEGIYRLVLVSDHDEVPCFNEQVKEDLFGPVEVLVLVHENVLEHAAMGRGGIISKVTQGFWN